MRDDLQGVTEEAQRSDQPEDTESSDQLQGVTQDTVSGDHIQGVTQEMSSDWLEWCAHSTGAKHKKVKYWHKTLGHASKEDMLRISKRVWQLNLRFLFLESNDTT